jgi:hypothetical protein
LTDETDERERRGMVRADGRSVSRRCRAEEDRDGGRERDTSDDKTHLTDDYMTCTLHANNTHVQRTGQDGQ